MGLKTGLLLLPLTVAGFCAYQEYKLPDQIPLRAGVYTISGSITKQTFKDFKRISRDKGFKIDTVRLDSQGGAAWSALDIADIVHEKGYETLISRGDQCDSSCTFIFMAGSHMTMGSDLGFHEPATAGIPFRNLTGARKRAAKEFEELLTRKLWKYGFKPETVSYMFNIHNEAVGYVDVEKLKEFQRK